MLLLALSFSATHRNLLRHCEVSWTVPHCSPFSSSIVSSYVRRCGVLVHKQLRNRWVFLLGADCCASPGGQHVPYRWLHVPVAHLMSLLTQEELSHYLVPPVATEVLSEANYTLHYLTKCMQGLYYGFEDDWLGFKKCIHQLLGQGHSGRTPTDSQTLCLAIIFCPQWRLNAKSDGTLQNMNRRYWRWFLTPWCERWIKTNSASLRLSFLLFNVQKKPFRRCFVFLLHLPCFPKWFYLISFWWHKSAFCF